MPLSNIKEIAQRYYREELIDQSQEYWGQWLTVNDVVKRSGKFLMLALLIKKNSAFKDRFLKYENFIVNYKSNTQHTGFGVREIVNITLPKQGVEGFGLLFPHAQISKLADIIEFKATENEYSIGKDLSKRDILNLFECLERDLISLHHNKVCHTFIDPNLIIRADNSYHLVLPNFHQLLEDISANIRTIFYNQPDLQVFPLAPELVKNPSLNNFDDIQKCDVWSLGILLYLLIAKRLPFRFNSEYEYLSAIEADQIYLEIEATTDTQICDLVRDALKTSPEQRITLVQFFERVKSIFSVNEPTEQQPSLKDSSPLNVEILEFNEQQIILSPGAKKRFGFDLAIEELNLKLENEYQLEVMVKSPDIQSGDGTKTHREIMILPTPKFKIIENEIRFVRDSKTDAGGNYRLRVPFRLLRSRVKLNDVQVKLLTHDGSEIKSQPKAQIKYPRELISTNNVGVYYCVDLSFFSTDKMSLGEYYQIEMIFLLESRTKPEEFKFNTVLRSPANLLIGGSEQVELEIVGSTTDDRSIVISNSGESNATLKDVVFSQGLQFISVRLFEKLDVTNNNSISLKLRIDGTKFSPGSSSIGSMTLIYDESMSGKVQEERKEFPVRVIFTDRFHNPIETIAIDFGTSNSCIAVRKHDGKTVLYDWGGVLSDDSNVPTFINYSEIDGTISVGKDAKTAFEAGAANCFNSIKRFFGSKNLNSIRKAKQIVFKSFTEIVTDYIEELTKHVSNNARTNLKTIVFTHPINWSIKNVKEFEKVISGLRVCSENIKIKFVDEATAGAWHVRDEISSNGNVMIFDIGGGTTDVVYGKLTEETILDELGEREEKKFVPVFTAGYDFGGDVLNEIIGMEVIRLLEKRDKDAYLLPFFTFENSSEIPGQIWHLVMSTYSRIWKFAEDFKLSLGGGNGYNKKIESVVPLKQDCHIQRIKQWQIEDTTPISIELSEHEMEELKENSLSKIGWHLEDKLSQVWMSRQSIESGDCMFILLGQSSKFKFLQHIFYHYFDPDKFDAKYLLGYKICDPHKIKPVDEEGRYSVVIPSDGKSLVAKGALQIFAEDSGAEFPKDSRVLSWIESHKYKDFKFKVGSKKVRTDQIENKGKLTLRDEGFYNEYAIICKNLQNVSNLNGIEFHFIEKTPHASPVTYGQPIIFEIPENVSGEAKLIMFLDLEGIIRWAIFNKNNDLIQKSWDTH